MTSRRGEERVLQPTVAAPDDPAGSEVDWGCSWEATRLRQLAAGLALTPAERLAWLEELIAFAAACGALPRRKR
jgi:hypothetical protein